MSERRQLGHWLTQTRQMKPTIVRRIKTLIIYAHPKSTAERHFARCA